jgi:hypothetical protein
LCRQAEQGEGALVPGGEPAAPVESEDALARVVERGAQQPGLFGGSALGRAQADEVAHQHDGAEQQREAADDADGDAGDGGARLIVGRCLQPRRQQGGLGRDQFAERLPDGVHGFLAGAREHDRARRLEALRPPHVDRTREFVQLGDEQRAQRRHAAALLGVTRDLSGQHVIEA